MATESERLRQGRGAEQSGFPVVTGLIVGLLVIAGVIIATFAVLAWLDDGDSEGFNVGVTLGDVTNDPESYYGERVTVSGEVNEVIHDRVLTLGGDGIFSSGELIVVSSSDVPVSPDADRAEGETVVAGDLVQVSGTVEDSESVDLAAEANIEDANVLQDVGDGPVLIATTVALNPRIDAPAGAIMIEDIADNEDLFANQSVALTGEVSRSVSSQAFLMQDATADSQVVRTASEQLLVVSGMDAVPDFVTESVPVEVSGTVRIFDSESADNDEAAFENEFGIDIEDGLLAGWEDDPVLIADSITTAGGEGAMDISQFATDPFAFEGRQVTTGGTVDEILHEQAIVLTNEDANDPVNVEVLVVGQTEVFSESVVPASFAQVTGTVHIWDDDFQSAVGNDFPFLFEDGDTFSDFEDGIVIVADSLAVER